MWVCRQWTYTALNGWCSDFDSFDTEREAIEHGNIFLKWKGEDEERKYEVYEATEWR